jgi:hypothetical protein
VERDGDIAVVTFDSTHQAMAAEDILREEGVSLEVVPPPTNLSAGCGLALRVRLKDVPAAIEALNGRGATYAAIHLLDLEQKAVQRLG